MSDFVAALFFSLGYNATVVGLGCAAFGLSAGAIGCFVLLRGRALISDAAAHATLPGVAGAFILAVAFDLNARNLVFLLTGAGLTAALAVGLVAALNRGGRLRDDASMALVLSIGYGIGVVLFSVVQSLPVGGQAGLKSFILGQAAGMNAADATIIASLALASALCLLVLFKQLMALCFDREFAASTGLPVRLLDAVLLALMLAVAVAGLRAVGLILVVGLMVIPAVTARLVTDRLEAMVPISAAIGAVSAWIGTAISAVAPQLPTGATIALTACAFFIVALLIAPQRGALAFVWRQARLSLSIARDHALRAMIEAQERGAPARDWHGLAEEARWSGIQRALLPIWFRREGWVTAGPGAQLALSPTGAALAREVTHRHRVWEHYMQSAGGLTRQAAHRAADEVEHALPPQVTRDAEAWLRRNDPDRLPPGAVLPPPGEGPSGATR